MSNITSKELSALEDQLNLEQVLVKKYRAFASQCSDQQLSEKCNQIADRHQTHYDTLVGHIQ